MDQPGRWRLVVSGVLLTLVSLAARAQPPHWQQPDYLQHSFMTLALASEDGLAQPVVHKWRQPLRLFIDHQVPDQSLHEQLLRAHTDHLSQITGHPIAYVVQAERANVRVIFTREQALYRQVLRYSGPASAEASRTAVCLAGIQANRAAEIVRATVYIPVDRARQRGKLLACIVEEITQVMGLANDSDQVYPSIFNDHSVDQLITGLDELLLRILYDPRIRPGMGREGLRQPLGQVIADLQQRQLIGTAAQRVRTQGRLYHLW